MHFAEPQWLLIGAGVVVVLTLLLVRAEVLKSRALALLQRARLGSPIASFSRARRWARVALMVVVTALGFVALARPQKGMHWETVERNGIDLLLVVDTSKSMDADDVKPTRLERAKLAMHDLVDRFPGDRIGIVAFAGDAFVQSPMTLDHTALGESLDALDTSVIARGGTNIGRGIDVAADALATEPGRQKIMVLMTDGEDLEGQGLAEAKQAGAQGITIDTIGVGTLAGELVPARDAHGATVGVVRDEVGKPVRSHLDEAGLKAIAEATHGSYLPLGVDGRGLVRLYDQSLANLTHVTASSRTHRVYSDWFQIPLALALLGLVLDALVGRRWLGRRARALAPALAAAVACLLLLSAPRRAHASVESAAKSYAAGRYEEAAKEFEKESTRNPKDARLAFNAGDAAYRAGDYEAAQAAFTRALGAADPHLQQRVLYNQGDVLYRAGESQKPEARDEIIAKWKAAITAYDGAIALDGKDSDARFNRDFVKRKLAALEQKKPPEPPPPPKSDDNKKKDDKSQGDKKQDDKKSGGSSGGNQPKPGDSGPQKKPSDTKGQGHTQGPGEEKGSGAPGLSPKDARALLGSLRGEERHGVSHGTAQAVPTDDTPRKDW